MTPEELSSEIPLERWQELPADSNITVLSQSHDSISQGREFYRQREDKGYSLTGSISMLVCQGRGIQQVLTRDHHFEQEGFTILF